MDTSNLTGILLNWLKQPFLWLILIIALIVVAFGILWVRKKKRLKFECMEFVDLGQGKSAINSLKAGWFGTKLYLNGLFWTGDEVLRVQSGEIIEDFSTEDYQEVNGRRGIYCYRDPLNQSILIPVNRVNFKNKELIASIAPSDYRDVAVKIFNEAVKETTDWKERIMQFVAWALVVVFSLVAIIVIVQYVKVAQEKAAELIVTASEKGKQACLEVLKSAVEISGGQAP